MIDELRKLFAPKPNQGMSGFQFSDLLNNDRWRTAQRDSYSPKRGELAVEGDPFSGVDYRQYVPREAFAEPSALEDAAPQFVPSPDAKMPYPEFAMLPEVTPQARPVPIRGIERGRTVYPNVPRATVVPPTTTAFPQRGRVSLPAPVPALPRPQTNVSRGYRTPPGGLLRGAVTGPYNPNSLDSYARYYQDRSNRLAENRARINQARTITVPNDPNTQRAYARAYQPQLGKGGTPTVDYRPFDPRNPWFYRRGAKNLVEGAKSVIGLLGAPLSVGAGLMLHTEPAEANHASGVVPQGGYFDSFMMDESYKPPTGLGPNGKRVTTETPDGKRKVVTTEEIDPLADQNIMGMETAPQFNYVPEAGETPIPDNFRDMRRDQYGNLVETYDMTSGQRDAVNELRRAQQFEQAENYREPSFLDSVSEGLGEFKDDVIQGNPLLKKMLGWWD
jgi:hypothetical protein